MGTIVSVNEVIGKDIFTIEDNVPVKNLPDPAAETIRLLPKGSRAGTVFSYLERSGQIWWMFDNGFGEYILHKPGRFNFDLLSQQGTKSELEKQRQDEYKTANYIEKLILTFRWWLNDNPAAKKTISWATILIAVIALVYIARKTGIDKQLMDYIKGKK
jgi:hypothetical protein